MCSLSIKCQLYTPPQPARKRRKAPKRPAPKHTRGATSARAGEEEEERWCNLEKEDTKSAQPHFIPVRPAGPQIDTSQSWSPLRLFQQFFSSAVMRTIVNNNSANTQRRKEAGLKAPWKPLSSPELFAFLRVLIFSGLLHVHDRDNMWRTDWPYQFVFTRGTMSISRSEAILWCLHLSKPGEDEENNREIAIDERMVAMKARISIKQYMKAKPTKWGYKLFVLADATVAYT
ncbi:hypothetical protein AAFF_G00322700 [Aldrovandia affinis]|uniref:PiggyBac transposable element-derived protein domain-containing protein n=1 Tax=Aldrovandia affinis TaxID=143900 RepID=A0AAD7SM89_9TELE|nr:hypothetical protein AAFF_G00322700 [Aldrovandia affinis]